VKVGETIWFASRIETPNATINEYSAPQKIVTRFNHITVMPATSRGYAEMMKYGEDVDSVWTVVANAKAFLGKFKVGDVFWVDGEKPNAKVEEEYGSGASANAVVKAVNYVNHSISIVLFRNKDKVAN
jgi:hypothetical protein